MGYRLLTDMVEIENKTVLILSWL